MITENKLENKALPQEAIINDYLTFGGIFFNNFMISNLAIILL